MHSPHALISKIIQQLIGHSGFHAVKLMNIHICQIGLWKQLTLYWLANISLAFQKCIEKMHSYHYTSFRPKLLDISFSYAQFYLTLEIIIK